MTAICNEQNMKTLRNVLLLSYAALCLFFGAILATYFIKFSGGISDNTDNWTLFISICNWGSMSLLTGLNIWVFFQLTSLIEKNEAKRFVENKLSRTEDAIWELRTNDYKRLREYATELKIDIYTNNRFEDKLHSFNKVLLSMSSSTLYSTKDKINNSVLDPVTDYLSKQKSNCSMSPDELIECIDRCLRTIEIIIFSLQMADERILKEVREHPDRFDPTLNSIDNFMKNL